MKAFQLQVSELQTVVEKVQQQVSTEALSSFEYPLTESEFKYLCILLEQLDIYQAYWDQVNWFIPQLTSVFKPFEEIGIAQENIEEISVPEQRLKVLLKQVETQLTPTFKEQAQLALLQLTTFEARQEKKELKQLVKKHADYLDSRKLDEYLTEASVIMKELRSNIREKAALEYKAVFQKARKQQAKASLLWGILLFVIIAGMLATSVWIADAGADYSKGINSFLVYVALPKLLIFSILFYTLSIVYKNYQNHMHGAALNRHREDALSTLELVIEGIEDESLKDSLRQEAAKSIFAPQATGYLQKDKLPIVDLDAAKIAAILKSLNNKK